MGGAASLQVTHLHLVVRFFVMSFYACVHHGLLLSSHRRSYLLTMLHFYLLTNTLLFIEVELSLFFLLTKYLCLSAMSTS